MPCDIAAQPQLRNASYVDAATGVNTFIAAVAVADNVGSVLIIGRIKSALTDHAISLLSHNDVVLWILLLVLQMIFS